MIVPDSELQLLRPPRSTGDRDRDARALAQYLWDFYRIAIVQRGLASTSDTTAAIDAAVQAAFDELQQNLDVILPTPYTIGDLLYASSTTDLAKLAAVAVGQALISGGAGAAPAWGKIGLTTHVSGVLAFANGGTGLSSGTSGGVLGFTGTTTLASSGALTQNALMVGGGAGALPSTPIGLGTSSQFLRGNASGPPSFSTPVIADIGIKTVRVSTGSIGAGATALVTATFGSAFADTNYTPSVSVLDSTSSAASLSVVHVESISTTGITVRVSNSSAGSLTGTLLVVAVHD